MKRIEIAPSILNANLANLEKEIKKVESLGIKFLHFDVMDGHFVPNISFGTPVLSCVSSVSNLINDVHLMISDPKKYSPDFKKAGADIITFHYEACSSNDEVLETIEFLKSLDVKVGLSIKPATTVEEIMPFLFLVDVVLVMSVEPGFGGQKFNPNAIEKIKKLDEIRCELDLNYIIEVDGGINDKTAHDCNLAGADLLVCGTYLYKSKNIEEDYKKLFE